jgi:hypothetical protein
MTRLKAKLFLTLIAINWGSLILIATPLMLVAYCLDRIMKLKWLYSILLAQDHYTHTIMGGHFLTTISAMLGHLKTVGSQSGTLVAEVVDWGFERATGQIDHCTSSMEAEDDFIFSARRAIAGTLLIQVMHAFIIYALYNTYF